VPRGGIFLIIVMAGPSGVALDTTIGDIW